MGGGSYSSKDWITFSTSRGYHDPRTKTKDIYSSRSIHSEFDPKNFLYRESVDSIDNPESTPVILGMDVTGSMSPVLDSIARKGMKTICEEIYKRQSITNPHICALGIGDVLCDRYPFQVTQFEADIRIFEQLEKIYLEQGGGGNSFESYILAWYFARYRTKTDSFAKRGVKGFIFTFGDEEITPEISSNAFEQFMGDSQTPSMDCEQLFSQVIPEWNVYHLIIKEGSHASRAYNEVYNSWAKVIGEQRVVPLDDHTKIGEVITSILDINAGKTVDEVKSSWDGSTSVVVDKALGKVGSSVAKPTEKNIDAYL